MFSENPRKLSSKLRAAPFNLSASFASELANRKRLPSFPLAIRLRDEAGIPLEFWAPEGVTDSEAPDGVISDPSHAAGFTSTDKAAEKIGQPAGEYPSGGDA